MQANPVKNSQSLFYFLLIVSFCEGGTVMACELAGAKLIAPYFGTSLYVWAAVLAVTLGGLACGYWLGGQLAQKRGSVNTLGILLCVAGLLTGLMPRTAVFVLERLIHLSIAQGSLIGLMLYLFPPLVLFGATSPLIIHLINPHFKNPGKSSGTIYAISTVGGILTTLWVGFVLLPNLGMQKMTLLFGGVIIVVGLMALLKNRQWKAMAAMLLLTTALFLPESGHSSGKYKVLMQSSGVLSEIKVLEHVVQDGDSSHAIRALLVDNVAQTLVDPNRPEFLLYDYPRAIPMLTPQLRKGQKALLLGLGGGILANQMAQAEFKVTAVELDERVVDAATAYFELDPRVEIKVDDARHYLNVCNQQYDLIIFDLFHSESPPAHALTLETFERAKACLTGEGMIIVNMYGLHTGVAGKGSRSVLKTLEHAGYHCDVLSTLIDKEEQSNLLIRANLSGNLPAIPSEYDRFWIHDVMRQEGNATVLTDDDMALERYYLTAALKFKNGWNEYYTKKLILNGYPAFD